MYYFFYFIFFVFFFFCFFFFNDTATTEIYTLSLHDALPISHSIDPCWPTLPTTEEGLVRSEEHTSELQSRSDLVCRLLLEKKKKNKKTKQKQKKKQNKPKESREEK